MGASFTTTMQLGQLTGVAGFGTVFLSMVPQFTPDISAHAISVTTLWMALLALIGAAAGVVLGRAVVASDQQAPRVVA